MKSTKFSAMKKLITSSLILCCCSFALLGQTTVTTGVNQPVGLALKGSQLYISEYLGSKISKADLSQNLPTTATTVLNGLTNPTGLLVIGDYLYFNTEVNIPSAGNARTGRINLTVPNPAIEQVVTDNFGRHQGFLKDGNTLYISGNLGIFKVDLASPLPQAPIVVLSGTSASGMALYGNELYFGFFDGDQVKKIDISQPNPIPTTVVSGLAGPDGVTINGNYLYISEAAGSRIVRIDVTEPNPVVEIIASGLGGPTLTLFDGLDLYFGEYDANKVTKVSVNQLSFSSQAPACSNNATVQRGGASPTGGVYSGPNVTDNGDGETYTFNAMAAGLGTYTVTYTFGTLSATKTLSVVAPPTVTLPGDETIDINAGVQPIMGGMPLGGTYSGPGINVAGTTFDPMAAGIGTHTITYTYTDGNGCSGVATVNITVTSADDGCAGSANINNLFGGALNIPVVSSQYDNTGYNATGDPTTGFDCFAENAGSSLEHTIWYSFTGDGNTYRIRTVNCGATPYNDDTQVAIYTGACGNLSPVACNDDEDVNGGVYNISIDIPTQAGVNYSMLIDGWNGTVGKFCLEVTKTVLSAVTNIDQTNIQLYPNPTTGEIQLRNVAADAVQVLDNMGRLVLTQENPGTSIDISNAPAGVYFLKIMAGEKVYSARVVKE